MVQCPKCQTQTVKFQLESGVEVEFCTECKGMWLEKGKLARGAKSAADFPDPMYSFGKSKNTELLCPSCMDPNQKLIEIQFDVQSKVPVDFCKKCQGIWLDYKEFPRVQEALKNSPIISTENKFPREKTASNLSNQHTIFVRQIFEAWELLGFETRNKYEILDQNHLKIAYAAEQGKGLWGLIVRQYLGHWRRFNINIYDLNYNIILIAQHPFRFFFQRMELRNAKGQYLGALQQKFSIFSKRFNLEDSNGTVLMQVNSPLFSIWTFPFTRAGMEVASIKKKWGGSLIEIFTDKDLFCIDYSEKDLTETERQLILASAIFIDLQYFEMKANS